MTEIVYEDDPNEWVAQAFFGPAALAATAKASTELNEAVGAFSPPRGHPPMELDEGESLAIFAIMTRKSAPVTAPDGMTEVKSNLAMRFI